MFPYYNYIAAQYIVEEEHQQQIRQQNIDRRVLRHASDAFSLPNEEFTSLYRLTKEMVQYLFTQLVPHMDYSGHPNAIPPQLRILAALCFLATGSYQRILGHTRLKAMGQTTVSKAINEVVNLIVERLSDEWIVFPQSNESKLRVKQGFMEKFHFPGVIGAIDCTHVAILAPREDEHNYVNRKGYHSKNIQVICDSALRILNVNANFAGAAHDSFIWNQSNVLTELQQYYAVGDRTSWLLGDSGYPQQAWLMTPFLNPPADSPQERYNGAHASARNVIERCFGLLKARFRCISADNRLRYSPNKVGNIFICCCILHNICLGPVPIHDEEQREAGLEGIQNAEDIGRNAREELVARYFN